MRAWKESGQETAEGQAIAPAGEDGGGVAEGSTDEGQADDDEAEPGQAGASAEDHEQGPGQVKAELKGQAPGVVEAGDEGRWFGRPVVLEVLREGEVIRQAIHRGGGGEESVDEGEAQEGEEVGGHQAHDAAEPESGEEVGGVALLEDDAGDEEAGEDEEEVDPGPAHEPVGEPEVVKQDGERGEGAKAVELRNSSHGESFPLIRRVGGVKIAGG